MAKTKKKFRKVNQTLFGAALALQATPLLTDRTLSGRISITEGFIGIGIAGAASQAAFNLVDPPRRRKIKRR